MASLSLENVSKRFGGLVAVADVSLDVPAGEITGLIGPNGAGKTTIINLITGMMALSDGRITMEGADIGTSSANRIARSGISRTFQNIRLLSEASVLDNVMIGFHRHETTSTLSCLLGLPAMRRETRRLKDDALALLDQFGMTSYADYPAGALAYGHQRRVEMMRALAAQPKVLLLDEPVAGMNDVEAEELGAIFETLSATGIGMLPIEHNVEFVTRLCRNIYVLDTGRLIAEGPADKVMHDPKVVQAYLGTA